MAAVSNPELLVLALTHRSFATYKGVQYVFAALGSMSVQGPVMSWVADHRKHHAHTDKDGDPHSPHGHGGGLKGALAGLWYAHTGWLFDRAGQAIMAKIMENKDAADALKVTASPRFAAAGAQVPTGLDKGKGKQEAAE